MIGHYVRKNVHYLPVLIITYPQRRNMKTKTKIINLIGAPSTGKSTAAASIFSDLKKLGFSIEYSFEVAKQLSYMNAKEYIENQIYVFSQQFTSQWSLIDKVEYVVTDSPLLLSSIYYEYYFNKTKQNLFDNQYKELAIEFYDNTFMSFNNINFYIEVDKSIYNSEGRHHDKNDVDYIDELIRIKLYNKQIEHYKTNTYDVSSDVIKYIKGSLQEV